MATLNIRNLDEATKARLRLRAAARNRSMEEEARQILRAALLEPAAPAVDLGTRIRARFAAFGEVELPVVEREAVRPPPDMGMDPMPPRRASRSTPSKPTSRR